MADDAYTQSLLGGLDAAIKQAVGACFRYAFKNYRFGAVEHQKTATNFQASWVTGTTAPVAGQEFSIAHGRGVVPMVALPVLPLDAVNARLVDLQVSRAADANRLYFTSLSTSAAVAFLVE